MKRIKAGCILQTLVFSQKAEAMLSPEEALGLNRAEAENYRARLKRDGVRHQITGVTEEPDGSIILRVRKQLNAKADVAEYFA